jgi:hypothetical protein
MSRAERVANAWHQRAAASKPSSESIVMNRLPLTPVGVAGARPVSKTVHLEPSFHRQGDASPRLRVPMPVLEPGYASIAAMQERPLLPPPH